MDADVIKIYQDEVGSPFLDNLTGSCNHGLFQLFLEREIQRYDRRGEPFAVAIVDADRFSVYNRRKGFQQGDRLLKEIAEVIRGCVRKIDVVGRYSDDRFIILYANADRDTAVQAAERLRLAVETRLDLQATVSIGVASIGPVGLDRVRLIENAHKALQEAKLRGKNQVCAFDDGVPESTPQQGRVLVVDDSKLNVKMLAALLAGDQYEVLKAYDGQEALSIADRIDVDLVLLDVMMPDIDGFEVCRRLKSHEKTRLTPVVLVTTLSDSESRIKGIEAGADDFVTKPPNKTELLARTRSLVQLKRLNNNLTSIENVLFSMAKAVEAKDAYTQGHVERTANLAVALGRKMEVGAQNIEALRFGGILHDIGKIGMPNAIINKPGKLTDEEWQIMQSHPDVGYNICLPLKNSLGAALEVIRHHHEKLDGSGYPDGLQGEQISSVARIMAVADIYDALTSDRSYRKGMPTEKAFSILRQEAEEDKLDSEVVEALIDIVTS